MKITFGKNGAAALEKVAALESERQQRAANFGELMAHANAVAQQATAAEQDFVRQMSPQSLHKMLVAKSLVAPAQDALKLLSHLASDRYPDRLWRDSRPERRQLLKDCGKSMLSVATKELDLVRHAEKKHLESQGFAADLEDAPAVKHARSRVTRLEQVLNQIESDDDSQVWRSAPTLLQLAK